ncbi:hypothetical protein SADUNF_Sadunf17G0040000 [Salix dunnii]|uniref:Uncharacterized protein n=1 Tax=Salix dunnii TaxID=1413687 RepID=A0A835J4F3_9ROSI|nr:hypothetical protein SADUNF_Sadunf17G0040000 [Salix dunnii]
MATSKQSILFTTWEWKWNRGDGRSMNLATQTITIKLNTRVSEATVTNCSRKSSSSSDLDSIDATMSIEKLGADLPLTFALFYSVLNKWGKCTENLQPANLGGNMVFHFSCQNSPSYVFHFGRKDESHATVSTLNLERSTGT